MLKFIHQNLHYLFMLLCIANNSYALNFIKWDYVSKTDLGQGGSIETQEQVIFLSIPFIRLETLSLIGIFGYSRINNQYNNVNLDLSSETSLLLTAEDLPRNLYKRVIGGGLLLPIRKSDAIFIRILSLRASDQDRHYNKDNQLIGGLIFIKNYKKKLLWRLGIIQTAAFGDLKILPVLGLRYFHKKYRLDINLPNRAEFQYHLTNKFLISLIGQVEGSKYQMTKEVWNQSVLHYSNIKSNLSIGYKIIGNLLFEIGGGFFSSRRWEFTDLNNNQVINRKKLQATSYFELQLRLLPTI